MACFSLCCGRGPRCALAKVLECDIVVSKFKLPLVYYVHFRTNKLKKGMNPLSTSYWLKSTSTALFQG